MSGDLTGLCLYMINFIPVPRVRIFGDRDIFVKSSSTVQLKCVISQSLSPPTYIEWLRNDEERLPSSFLGVSSSASFDQVKHEVNNTTFLFS